MDKEKVVKGIMHILLKHTKEEYVGATGYIKFHEEDFLLFAKELAERIEIDEDIVMQVLRRYWGVLEESYYIDENGWENKDFIKLLVKSCPIKIKEADDEI